MSPGAFETMRALGGDLPLWELHLERLASSATGLGLPFDPPADLRAAARAELARNDHADDVLRITLSLTADGTASWSLRSRPRVDVEGPLQLISVCTGDLPPPTYPAVKCTERAHYDTALALARDAGGHDALLHDAEGHVLETAVGNVFVGLGGHVLTPPLAAGILPGVARRVLCEALPEVRERALTLDEVRSADWLAVTNAVHGPRPAMLRGGPAGPGGAPRAVAVLADAWRVRLARGP